jgi:PhoH-like ATPase
VTRVTVPVGEDIGFLPGTEEEKMSPWMGAFDDNLEVLNKSDSVTPVTGAVQRRNDLIRSKIKHQVDELHARPYLRQQVPDHR